MGTHPIFESDFDCLTETRIQKIQTMSEVKIQKKRTFKKYTFRGVDLDQLLDMKSENLIELPGCRQRRHSNRGIKRREENFLKRLRKAKKAMTGEVGEKPAMVKTHLRDVVVVPEMVGSIIGIYNGKVFNQIEVKPEMINHYIGEFSMTYKPVRHGRPGIGATHSSRFIPLK